MANYNPSRGDELHWAKSITVTFLTAVIVLVMVVGGRAQSRMSFTGYGELHYNNPSVGIAQFDMHRLVLGWGYQFTDRISFAAELDFEHAFTEPELEFAYLDYFYRDAVSFRGGVMLMPVGPLNEFHEPPLYYSVERPYVQKYVIPTTWQEPGAGVFGTIGEGSVGYRAYVVGGLDASRFRAKDGIRKGRQKAAEAKAEDLAAVVRLEWSPSLSVSLGASGYAGRAAQGDPAMGNAAVAMGEVDGLVKLFGFEIRGMYVFTYVNDADSVSTNNESGTTVGEEIVGWNAEVALRILRTARVRGKGALVVFARYEDFDTQHEVPEGFNRNPKFHRTVVTAGVSFLPVARVALKADTEFWESEDGARWKHFNIGLAFMF